MDFYTKSGEKLDLCQRGARKSVDLKKVTFSTDDDGQLKKFFYDKKPMKVSPLGKGGAGAVYKLSRGDVELVWKVFYDDDEMESELEAFRTLEDEQAGSCRVLSEGRERMGIVMQIMDGSMRDFLPQKLLHPETVLGVCVAVAESLQCLWRKRLFYSDVKPANTLYKCLEDGKVDVVLGDVGDIVDLREMNSTNRYVETFAYPYEAERLDFKVDTEFAYDDLTSTLTVNTVEDHMVWSVACFFFTMLTPFEAVKYLTHARRTTKAAFLEKRREMAGLLDKAPYSDDDRFAWFAAAIVDPTSVRLSEVGKALQDENKALN